MPFYFYFVKEFKDIEVGYMYPIELYALDINNNERKISNQEKLEIYLIFTSLEHNKTHYIENSELNSNTFGQYKIISPSINIPIWSGNYSDGNYDMPFTLRKYQKEFYYNKDDQKYDGYYITPYLMCNTKTKTYGLVKYW